MFLCDWYSLNEPFIQFTEVIIKCLKCDKLDSNHPQDNLFECVLKWKDALRMFGHYRLQSISQGYHVTDYRSQECMYTLMCSVYFPEEEAVDV